MITKDVKVFDDKLNDFILDVREALVRLETNLIDLNKITSKKIEQKMVVTEES